MLTNYYIRNNCSLDFPIFIGHINQAASHTPTVLEALGWISPQMKALVMVVDRFDNVYNNELEGITKQLGRFC